jgi:hypothetical protein
LLVTFFISLFDLQTVLEEGIEFCHEFFLSLSLFHME